MKALLTFDVSHKVKNKRNNISDICNLKLEIKCQTSNPIRSVELLRVITNRDIFECCLLFFYETLHSQNDERGFRFSKRVTQDLHQKQDIIRSKAHHF